MHTYIHANAYIRIHIYFLCMHYLCVIKRMYEDKDV